MLGWEDVICFDATARHDLGEWLAIGPPLNLTFIVRSTMGLRWGLGSSEQELGPQDR